MTRESSSRMAFGDSTLSRFLDPARAVCGPLLILLSLCTPAFAHSQLTDDFIHRLAEPAIDGRPFDLSGMSKDTTTNKPYIEYSDESSGFSVMVLQEGKATTAISMGQVNGRHSTIAASPLVRSFSAFSITKEDELSGFFKEFDAWIIKAQKSYHAQECKLGGAKRAPINQIYGRAVKFTSPDGKPGLVSLSATKRHYSASDKPEDLFITFSAVLELPPKTTCEVVR